MLYGADREMRCAYEDRLGGSWVIRPVSYFDIQRLSRFENKVGDVVILDGRGIVAALCHD